MRTEPLTIGRLAKTAAVGIETIHYYQRRRLLPVPRQQRGAFRVFPAELIERIRFIKRAQAVGFTLEEVAELLRLANGGSRAEVRLIAAARLSSTGAKIADLKRMELTLSRLLAECEQGKAGACPIIAALRFDAPGIHA